MGYLKIKIQNICPDWVVIRLFQVLIHSVKQACQYLYKGVYAGKHLAFFTILLQNEKLFIASLQISL